MKPTHTTGAVSKIDSRLEQYTSAVVVSQFQVMMAVVTNSFYDFNQPMFYWSRDCCSQTLFYWGFNNKMLEEHLLPTSRYLSKQNLRFVSSLSCYNLPCLLCKLGVALEGLSHHLLSDSHILFLADDATSSRELIVTLSKADFAAYLGEQWTGPVLLADTSEWNSLAKTH